MNQKQVKKLRRAVKIGNVSLVTKGKFRRIKKAFNQTPRPERQDFIGRLRAAVLKSQAKDKKPT